MAIFLVFGKHSLFSRPFSCGRRNFPYPDRLRHAQVGERVDDRRPDVGFVDLPFKGSGVQAVAQLLEPVHHVLGNAAPVVAAIVLPAVEPVGLDFLEDDVAGVVISHVTAPSRGGMVARASRSAIAAWQPWLS